MRESCDVVLHQMQETVSKSELIARNAILSHLGPSEQEALASAGRWASYERGEQIWQSGNQVQWMGLIASGFVKMVRSSESGKEAVLEIMGPNQTFGCLGVIEGSGCPLSAQCITNVELLQIPRMPFLQQYEGSLALQKEMIRVSTRRLFAKLDIMARLTSGRVDSRIANVLLTLCESYGRMTADGVLIDVPLTRQDLSDFTGVTLESVIRTMSFWQKQKWIMSQRSVITILNSDRIETIARGY